MLLISLVHIRALLPLASTDETRFNLNGIHIGKDGEAVATDGHAIGMIKEAVPFNGDLTAAMACKHSNPRAPGLILRRDVLEDFAKQWRVANGVVVDFERARACLVSCADLKRGVPHLDSDAEGWRDDVFVRNFEPTAEALAAMKNEKLRAELVENAKLPPTYPHVWSVLRHPDGGFGDKTKETGKRCMVPLALGVLERFDTLARLDKMGEKLIGHKPDEPHVVEIHTGLTNLDPVGLRFAFGRAEGMIMPCRM